MSVRSCHLTDIGRQRQMNQDYVFTSEMSVGALPNLFMVADGMGGYKAGEYASKNTVDIIVSEMMRSKETRPVRLISDAIGVANKRIRDKSVSDDNYKGMGTTLVLSYFDGQTLTVANIGDSRLYLLSDELRQITTDHSLVEEMIKVGGLSRDKARSHPDKNIITRAVGVVEKVDIDFFEVEDIRDGDIALMCSDGLSNMMDDRDIESILKGPGDLAFKARRLVDGANRNGGKDNISVVLVQFFVEEKK